MDYVLKMPIVIAAHVRILQFINAWNQDASLKPKTYILGIIGREWNKWIDDLWGITFLILSTQAVFLSFDCHEEKEPNMGLYYSGVYSREAISCRPFSCCSSGFCFTIFLRNFSLFCLCKLFCLWTLFTFALDVEWGRCISVLVHMVICFHCYRG